MRGKQFAQLKAMFDTRIIPAHAGQTLKNMGQSSHGPDHPRACGANTSTRRRMCRHCGSSPRMRGKRPARCLRARRVRIIPAHAGQTQGLSRPSSTLPDHPRACGANIPLCFRSCFACGSSPRMRGKLGSRVEQLERDRIIPAHAGQTVRYSHDHSVLNGSSPRMRGKPIHIIQHDPVPRIIPAHAGQTRWCRTGLVAASDHPRACGANGLMVMESFGGEGSSPRMRGKPLTNSYAKATERIIPAHAGQTGTARLWFYLSSDHPRACGANPRSLASIVHPSGSSPRMRGKHTALFSLVLCVRIIPAHAGQTSCRARPPAPRADHPRACGANLSVMVSCPSDRGSSPRMRGKRSGVDVSLSGDRIIPAHAGQTWRNSPDYPASTDHPRACGANPTGMIGSLEPAGSSPRMRGKLGRSMASRGLERIIPAHAGQTDRP